MSERVTGPGRGKRPAQRIHESSSDSDSDCKEEVVLKRKKVNVIKSESSDSSDSEFFSKPRKKMHRVWTDSGSSSEEEEEESEDCDDTTGCDDTGGDEDEDVSRSCGRVRRCVESEDNSSGSETEDVSSESGHSSVDSFDSYDNTDEEAMVQAAIQESLATVNPSSEPQKQAEESAMQSPKAKQPDPGFVSDSSDGQSDKCPICLVSFSTQEIGSPETCDHNFCCVCIQEWAKNVNTCPVDRQPFTLILVRKQLKGKVIRKIPVETREARDPQESDSDPTFCEVCGRSDREDRLLLCDGCDLGYHLECLDPPMENVPVEEWFCPDCATDESSNLAEEIDIQVGEVFDLLNDSVQIHRRRLRLLPRTRQSERVRASIRSLHLEMTHQDNDEPALQQPSTSGIESVGADSGSVTSGRNQTSATVVTTTRKRKIVRRKTLRKRRKRRTTKKRRTIKRKLKVTKKSSKVKGSDVEDSEEENEEEYVPKTKRRKRRKRKVRRKKKKISRRNAARTAVPRSVKGRLANQLGLCAPSRPGMSLPVVRSRAVSSDIDLQRSRAGIPALHIFGPQNELDYFSSDNEEPYDSGGNVAVAARPRNAIAGSSRLLARKKVLSAAALRSHTAVTSPKPVRNKVQLEGSTVASNSPVDLIGSILDSQSIWHSKTSSVIIKPDGSLEVNKNCSGPAVANRQGTVVCGSVSNKNKTDNGLIRSDDKLSEVSGSSSSPIDLGSASARTTQTPLYPGRGDSNRPPPNSGFQQFGGNRYSAPNYSNYQGVRDFSNFSSTSSNFDANSTRAGYSNYLNSGLPPPLLRNTPVRFRVTPRYPIRRPHGSQRPQDPSKTDDKKLEDGNEGNQRHPGEDDDNEDDGDDDEIDIYSDIEAGGGGSGGPSGGGSEQDDTEKSMETSYEALPPPPEPSALLMGFGEQLLSEEEPTSDSELVIDDNRPSSPTEHGDGPQIPESDKYDPAEPLADSDEDEPEPEPSPVVKLHPETNPVFVPSTCSEASDNSVIPLPPSPPASLPYPPGSNIVHSASNSNATYLHSPTYGDTSFESDKITSVGDNGVVNKVVKEVIEERLKSSPGLIQVGSGSPRVVPDKEDDTDECPNFSIYSAASMDIARRTAQEDDRPSNKDNSDKLSENENKLSKDSIDKDNSSDDGEDKLSSPSEDKSPMSLKELKENLDSNDTDEDLARSAGHASDPEKNASDEEEEVNQKGEESDSEEDEVELNVEKDCVKKAAIIEKITCDKDDSERDSEESDDDVCIKKTNVGQEENENKKYHDVEKCENSDEDSVAHETNVYKAEEEDFYEEKVVNCSVIVNKKDAEVDIEDIEGEKSAYEDYYPKSPSPKLSPRSESNVQKVIESSSTETPVINKDSYENDSRKTRIDDPFESDDDSLSRMIGGVSSAILVPGTNPPAPSGLEGLETETISETEEAINFEDISPDRNELMSFDEDGEILSGKKRKKKRNRKSIDNKVMGGVGGDQDIHREHTPPEEGEIIDDRPKVHDSMSREKKSLEKVENYLEKEVSTVCDENFNVSKPKDDDKKKKKKDKRKSSERNLDRPILSSSENRRRSKEKSRRSEEQNISWKKPSKSTKERNYREAKSGKPEEVSKDREKDDDLKDTSNKKKKKEKRKDMERYDVRKIVSDKRRRRKDEFGRDLSRDRTLSRSRSRSHRRSRDKSRSLSKNKRHRSPARVRRSRSRSRYRSRSRSHRRSRSKSKNRSRRKSKERSRRSRSKDRPRARVSRSRSRGRRSRSRSQSHGRSKNKQRVRTRSRSPLKPRDRKERVERSHLSREVQRFHTRRSWSRTWTPSWSRSHSRSISCSSFSQSRSPSVRHFNRSFSRSFSRSWSRERYERIPLEKTGALSSKAPKKLTVIVSNTKESQKKDKKKKKEKRGKESLGAAEKRKKRKEKSPAPSKEVFTSGDNILVSVNFNKSKTTNKEVSSLPPLTKESNKRKREEVFEIEREIGKKVRKEKVKDKNKAVASDKIVPSPQPEKKGKKQVTRGNKNARMAAILKQKPVAIIDLDQSPFREQTPSPRDLIVLSDSEEEARNKSGEHEEIGETLSVCRGMRPDSSSPQSPAKVVHTVSASLVGSRSPESELKLLSAVSNYLNASTGPKTPPEPQIKFSIASKQPQLRSINNPLQEEEEEEDDIPEDAGLDDSDQRIEEELDRSLGDIVHKGPNTPPEPRGPSTPCSPPTSPDAYDPFDPTKSGTPSPVGPEASMDGPPSPLRTPADELQLGNAVGSGVRESPSPCDVDDVLIKNSEIRNKSSPLQSTEEVSKEPCGSPDRAKPITRETKSPIGISESITPQLQGEELPPVSEVSEVTKVTLGLPPIITSVAISESNVKSPERKIGVVITTQTKLQSTPVKTPVFPIPSLKQIPVSQQAMTSTPSHTAPPPLFPALTPVNIASMLCTPANITLSRTPLFSQPTPLSVPSLLQHVTNAASSVQTRLPSDKPPVNAGPIRSLVQNGEPLPKPQDTTTEVVDMDLDSPYSPGSSEGDDLFDPPADTPSRSSQPGHPPERTKAGQPPTKGLNKLAVSSNTSTHKSPNKTQDKFDSIFGLPGVPIKAAATTTKTTRSKGHKGTKAKAKHVKGGKKEIAIKMDEDQLQILDELPSSAVELQVKDKFLKKLNRQERVVEEVKLSLKPHYNRKHITKEEYKSILRKSVPKICHNKSGEINPVKIATLVEAYVKKVRYEKKKTATSTSNATNSTPAKAKGAKTTKWS